MNILNIRMNKKKLNNQKSQENGNNEVPILHFPLR